MKTKGLFLLLFFCFFLVQPTGWASEANLLITQEQLNNFDSGLNELESLIEASRMTTNASALKIVSLEKNLTELLSRLKKATDLQRNSAQIIARQSETLKQQEKLLQDLEELAAKLERKISKLERNNSIGVYGNTTSAGIFVTHERIIVFGGQKYSGGIEVGAGMKLIIW